MTDKCYKHESCAHYPSRCRECVALSDCVNNYPLFAKKIGTKVHIIADDDAIKVQDAVNRFIKDKEVIDIKYQAVVYQTRDGYGPTVNHSNDRVLIIYKEAE